MLLLPEVAIQNFPSSVRPTNERSLNDYDIDSSFIDSCFIWVKREELTERFDLEINKRLSGYGFNTVKF